ncbi:MAG: sodium-dependent bicarbonate transport family permease [Eubacteriales bacterium]|nr:sodium-dependent bicarbonate transport family permease [Bacillota bacterium]MBV1728253.1 sodium-dependent bicarbonate transport family permease [Desulforudis sp.]MDQ7790419.1 sodium-dependent bicarbonate transport family permease [Clostridia bacterium]MDZ4042288.1 sodium-dependent bicarbonate transport family permease [Eubacteriales bacterium]MBU4533553.1 sodium-dependent bicarbonate transport family permease [Bacillota bacterium]
MASVFEVALVNLLSPVILFFGLGLLIALTRAKVEFPSSASDFITIYLLIAIGFKGGVAIAENGLTVDVAFTVLGAVLVGALIPVYSFFILWRIGKLRIDDAAAIAGHYGSISVVTFVAGTAFLGTLAVSYEGFIYGLPAVMELPGVISALMLVSWIKEKNRNDLAQARVTLGQTAKRVVLSKSVVLLLGGLVVGYVAGPQGMASVEFFYRDLFLGVLSLFMLEMGIIAGGRLADLWKAGWFLVLFGIVMPPLNALGGLTVGVVSGLSVGGTMLLGLLAASCSYIVAPAAMRMALPKANPALYLGISVGVTLPFNLLVGIPLYYYLADYLVGIVR